MPTLQEIVLCFTFVLFWGKEQTKLHTDSHTGHNSATNENVIGRCLLSGALRVYLLLYTIVFTADVPQKATGIFPSGPPANLRTYSTLHPTTGNMNLRATTPAITTQQQVSLSLSLYFSGFALLQN